MKQGITITRDYDRHDTMIVRIQKRRGKLGLSEIEELLRYGSGQEWCGNYAILLNCSEATIGGSGYDIFGEDPGDVVDLYPIEEGEYCPICGKFVPPFLYCPTCGTSWKDCDDNVEKLLEGMKEETERMILTSSKHDSKVAWYWSHIGAIDMARQLGLISDERRLELYREIEKSKPAAEGGDPRE